MHPASFFLVIFIITLWCKTCGCKEMCDLDNEMCITPRANKAYHELIYSEDLVPIRINHIITETSDYKFELFNTTFLGFENCDVVLSTYDLPNDKLVYVIFCPRIFMTTNNTFTGTIANVTDIDVKGGFTISGNKIITFLTAKYSLNKKGNGTFMTIEEFDIEVKPVGMFQVEQLVLTDGDAEEAVEAAKYLNNPGYETLDSLGTVWIRESMQVLVYGSQSYLSKVPLEKKFAID